MGKRRPYWALEKWIVKAVATGDAPSGAYKRGDWIMIHSAATKKEAQQLAKLWSATEHTPTMVEPGSDHKTSREF